MRPSSLPKKVQFLFFKKGIYPDWDKDDNVGGGRFVIMINKYYADKLWEDLILHFITNDCIET